ncbi:MAG: hypothetical protein JWN17_2951 [Frankiales bacterium]|nr:hypothetical protein [Frankiales bacterium]
MLLREEGWRRVFRDVYCSPVAEDGPALRCRALARVLPRGVAFSHRTALWLLGVGVLDGALDVTAPRGRHLERRPGVRTHSASLPEHDLCDAGGLLATSAARAVVDVARSIPLLEAVAVGDAAVRSGRTTTELLQAALDDAVGLRGCRRAREVFGLLDGRSDSPPESRLRVGLVRAGLPGVEPQVDLYDADGHVARADLLVDGLVVVEVDGREAHTAAEAFVRDRRRQNRLLAAGVELRRFSAADVTGARLSWACTEVARALVVARGRPPARVRRGPSTLRTSRLTVPPTLADSRSRQAA